MTTNKTDLIFDVLSDGIVFFGPTGAARFVSRAARELFGPRVETLYTDERVQRALARVKANEVKLPLECELDFAKDGQLVPIRATILDWKAGGGHTFVLRTQTSGGNGGHDLPATFELINRELAPAIRMFIDQAQAATAASPELVVTGRELVTRLSKLVELTEVFGTDAILADERVPMREIVDEIWGELAPLAKSRSVGVALHHLDTDLPPIYGSRKWLRRAIAEVLHNAIVHSPPGRDAEDLSLVEASAMVEGPWLAIEVENRGRGFRHALAGREFLPFSNAQRVNRPKTEGLGVGLPLAQRIVELHGGHLGMDSTQPERIKVSLRLPTGAPQRTTRGLDMAQAQKYAQDLAKLLARRARKADATA